MIAYPLVSVGVFCHDHARFVSACLDSVVASGYPNLQLVVVDDGSSDETDAELRRWLEAHPGLGATHLRHATPQGVGRSLNDALAVCRGEFLTGLSGDDTLLPGSIGARVEHLQARPDKLAVFADAHVIDERGERTFESAIEGHFAEFGLRKRDLCRERLLASCLAFHFAVPGPVFLCRRRAFDVVGCYAEDVVTEDLDMYLRLAAIGALSFLDTYAGCYRRHATSMTRRQHERMLADGARVALRRAREFRGAPALRLRAKHDFWQAGHAAPGWRRLAYRARAGALLGLAQALWRLERWRAERIPA